MVIRVLVEGGTLPPRTDDSDQAAVYTTDGSEVLREELRRFFERALGRDDVSIVVQNAAGYRNAVKWFINDHSCFLYTDLDDKPEHKNRWFQKMEHSCLPIAGERAQDVFFWIPEMEVWFLKQPASIEKWAASEGISVTSPLADDSLIRDKDLERLQHKPSYVMGILFKRCLHRNRLDANGKPCKMVYGKLRHAPHIISFLEPSTLIMIDSELRRFVNRVETISRQLFPKH